MIKTLLPFLPSFLPSFFNSQLSAHNSQLSTLKHHHQQQQQQPSAPSLCFNFCFSIKCREISSDLPFLLTNNINNEVNFNFSLTHFHQFLLYHLNFWSDFFSIFRFSEIPLHLIGRWTRSSDLNLLISSFGLLRYFQIIPPPSFSIFSVKIFDSFAFLLQNLIGSVLITVLVCEVWNWCLFTALPFLIHCLFQYLIVIQCFLLFFSLLFINGNVWLLDQWGLIGV